MERGRGGGHNRSQQQSSGGLSVGWPDDSTNGTGNSNGRLIELNVRGWKNSKAADENDGGIRKLEEFLERKASKITKVKVILLYGCFLSC